MTVRATDRWKGVTGLAFAAVAVGVLLSRPVTFLVSVVGVGYAAYAQATEPPEATVDVRRDVADETPDPEDEVAVTVTVTNTGGDVLPDLRLVDGVPRALAVVEGSPRLAATLRPGDSATTTYEVEASRGVHGFEPTTVLTRNWSGTVERETDVGVPGEVECVPELEEGLESFPLRNQTIEHAGRVTTDTGGSGIEFHSTREYEHGDPMNRIDWNRLAKTGEFTTVELREERAATVALVVDTRQDAYVSDGDGTSAVEHSVAAAREVAVALMDDGNSVGAASYGPVWSWQEPGLGRDHRARLRETLATADGFDPLPSGDRYLPRATLRRLRKNLPGDAQVVFFSPVADDYLVTTLRRIEAYGHRVTLVSPDVTGEETPGDTVARLEREERLRAVRRSGVRVVDWDPDDPLRLAVENAQRGWTR